MPMMARSVVVLPTPLRPSSVTTSPSPTAKLMPCRMCDSPYQPCRSSTRSISFWKTCLSGITGPHVGFTHLGLLRRLLVIPLGQDAAAGQHGDRVREVGDDREVVL